MSQPNSEFAFPPALSIAVVIMSSISCLTTAIGIEPMIGNRLAAFAFAVAASMFMVVIAVQYAKTDSLYQRRMAFFGYSLVAVISILFNFNAIYGTFNKDSLLYDEISAKRDQLVKLRTATTKDIKEHFEVTKWAGEFEAAKGKAEAEDNTPGDEGKGEKYKKIWRDEVIPAQGKLQKANSKAAPHLKKIGDLVSSVYPKKINNAIESESPRRIRQAITETIGVYNELSNEIGSITSNSYGSLTFDERKVGSMNNAIKQIMRFSQKSDEDKAGVVTSLFLSIIIDFIIIFVVVFYAQRLTKKRRGRFGSGPTWGSKGTSKGNVGGEMIIKRKGE